VRVGWRGALLAASLLGACAYYNGLYNANRLAGDARRAEREGRPGEARSLWAQAAVKAESVATRYPGSKYRDDALLLWGQGLARAGGCNRAMDPLGLAVDSSPDPRLRREARLTLADCQLSTRRPDAAIATLAPLLEERDSAVVMEARHLRGLANLKRRDPAAAIDDLSRLPPEVAGLDLVSAYLVLGDAAEAQRALEARTADRYEESRWLPLLDTLGAASPQAAAQVVDRLSERDDLTTGQQARLALADGRRWAAVGRRDRAEERYRAASGVAPDSAAGRSAAAYLVLGDLVRVTGLGELPPVQQALEETQRSGGPGGVIVEPAANLVGALQSVLESEEPISRDVRLFLLGEMFRDSLDLPHLATAIFLRMAQDHPESEFAPKALLAAVTLDPVRADSVARVLDARYPASPYTLALSGAGGPRFTQLEDSLGTRLAQERQLIRGGRFLEADTEQEGRVRR
jgi:hypothetical protein